MNNKVDKFPSLYRTAPRVLQINVGKKCNQVCTHCHVDAGPDRTEDMSAETADKILDYARDNYFHVADITGGAPEINASFAKLLAGLSASCGKVIVRCNLTAALSKKSRIELMLKQYKPEVVASLPCYESKGVDGQRGEGTFEKSIRALQWLNSLGYGTEHKLTLVYNPTKPILPPSEKELERSFRQHLKDEHDIVFTNLIAIANVPVGRFKTDLQQQGLYDDYLKLLKGNFNHDTIEGLMCRSQINVDWQGRVYDCDFNNQLELSPFGRSVKLWEMRYQDWLQRPIATREHCFTCTAGCGSSCGGSIS